MIIETEGIVLKQIKTVNGRKMLSVFTPKYGKISVGTNITPSKSNKASLYTRPFTFARYNLFKGKDAYSLNSAEVIESYYEIGEDYDKYVTASFALELTDRIVLPEDPNPNMFSLLNEFLKELLTRKAKYDTLLLSFMVKALSIMGVMPELENCALCGTKEKLSTFFSIESGGLICENCVKNMLESDSSQLLFKCDFDIINIIIYFLKEPLKAFRNIALDSETEKQLKKILLEYFRYHLDVGELKTEKLDIN